MDNGMVALRKAMVALRLAEFREGVWIRPDNLVRERPVPPSAELLPPNWPGTELRARYAEFRTTHAERLRDCSQG